MKLLLVEPTRLYQNIVTEILSRQKLRPLLADTGAAAMDILGNPEHGIDIVCISMHLPDISGVDLCHQIRAHESLSSTPILLITSESNPETLGRAFRAGATDILKKDNIGQFYERVSALVPVQMGQEQLFGRILYLEDDEFASTVAETILVDAGLEVFHAGTIDQALTVLESNSFDLIATDILLEADRTGIEFIKILRQNRQYQTTPILAVSGTQDKSRRLAALSAGANDYLAKPFVADELIIRARSLLAIKRLFDQLERDRELLREMASTDALTGLYNRAFLTESAGKRISEARRHNQDISLIVLDIDHFKKVNDTYGHDVGDTVIKATGKAMQEFFRKEDLAARFGGEEFVVLLAHCPLQPAGEKAELLRSKIESLKPGGIGYTISVGVTALHPDEDNFDKMFKRADQALYKSKQGGRNRVTLSE